jgi:hypothetical protein
MKQILVCMIAALCVAGIAQANLLKNSGFESGVELAWSPNNETTNWYGWGDVEAVGAGWKTPHGGNQTLVLKNWLGGGDGVEQKPDVTADAAYDLSFYTLWDGGYDGTLDAQVRWLDSGGAQIGSNTLSWSAGAQDTWNFTSARVTSMVNSARAEINFNNSGGTAGALYLDDVNFAGVVVPEPTTAALFGLLGIGLLAVRRRARG